MSLPIVIGSSQRWKRDVREAGGLEDVGGGVGVGHRERCWTASWLVVLGLVTICSTIVCAR
jgi:hypothetical protein